MATLQETVEKCLAEASVPGLVAGVSRDGQVELAAAGIRNLNTGQPMATDTIFLTGSITKVWMATLAMTFVDEGLLDLDAPVRAHLPEFGVGDPHVSEQTRIRHLLNHTSGWDTGDLLVDVGEGTAGYRRFLDVIRRAGQVHPLGKNWSYNNGPFVVLALVLTELAGGQEWSDLLTERVIKPLGLRRTMQSCEEAILFSPAVGSLPTGPDGEQEATRHMLLSKTFAPAGATLFTCIEDQLAFLRMHIADGVGDDGTRIISAESAKLMRQVTTPEQFGPGAAGIGLGWVVQSHSGQLMVGHAGGSYGGIATAAILPDEGLAVAAFGNGSMSGGAATSMVQAAVLERHLPGVPVSAVRASSAASTVVADDGAIDLDAFVGTYRRASVEVTVQRDRDELLFEATPIWDEAGIDPSYVAGDHSAIGSRRVKPVGANLLPGPTVFLDPTPDGFQLLFAGGRIHRRVDGRVSR